MNSVENITPPAMGCCSSPETVLTRPGSEYANTIGKVDGIKNSNTALETKRRVPDLFNLVLKGYRGEYVPILERILFFRLRLRFHLQSPERFAMVHKLAGYGHSYSSLVEVTKMSDDEFDIVASAVLRMTASKIPGCLSVFKGEPVSAVVEQQGIESLSVIRILHRAAILGDAGNSAANGMSCDEVIRVYGLTPEYNDLCQLEMRAVNGRAGERVCHGVPWNIVAEQHHIFTGCAVNALKNKSVKPQDGARHLR